MYKAQRLSLKRMNHKLKKILIAASILVVIPIVLFFLFITTIYMYGKGVWPFKPLDKVENVTALSNGAIVRITALEDLSEGWSVSAQYRPPDSSVYEDIGHWFGYNHDPKIYLADGLVVLLNPNHKTIHVRTNAQNPFSAEKLVPDHNNVIHVPRTMNQWNSFSMIFPHRHSSHPITFYTSMTTLTEQELNQIDPREEGWTPAISVEEFDPATREFLLRQVNSNTTRYIYLQLSEDGTDLSLIKITNEKIANQRVDLSRTE